MNKMFCSVVIVGLLLLSFISTATQDVGAAPSSVVKTAENYKKSGERYKIYQIKDYDFYVIVYFKFPSSLSASRKPYDYITGTLVVDKKGKEMKKSSLDRNIFYVPAVLIYYGSTPLGYPDFSYYAREWNKNALDHEEYAKKIKDGEKYGAALVALNFISLAIPTPGWAILVSLLLFPDTLATILKTHTAIETARKIRDDSTDAAKYERELAKAFKEISHESASISNARKIIPGQGSLEYKIVSKWISIAEGIKKLAGIIKDTTLQKKIDKEILDLKQTLRNQESIKSKIGGIKSNLESMYRYKS